MLSLIEIWYSIATQLCRFMEKNAIEKNLPIGVAATRRSAQLHEKAGYCTLERAVVCDERPGHEAQLETFLQEWAPPTH